MLKYCAVSYNKGFNLNNLFENNEFLTISVELDSNLFP